MDGNELIQRLKSLKVKFPSPDDVVLDSHELSELIAEAEALVGTWNNGDAIAIKTKA